MAIKVTMNLVVLSLVVVAVALVQSSRAETLHVVGGTLGWAIPPGNSSNPAQNYYTDWAINQTFAVGDVLLFNFTTGEHNVVEVASKTAYSNCNATNALSTKDTGPTNITLTAGEHFYICSFGNHCREGQRLMVVATSPPPPSSAARPPAATSALPITLVSIFVALLH